MTKISSKLLEEIRQYCVKRLEEGANKKEIRKEVFKKWEVDTTQHAYVWEERPDQSGNVKEGKEIMRTTNITKTKEPITFNVAYGDSDLAEMGKTLAHFNSELLALEEQKKSVMSDYKAKMDAKQEQINEVSRKVNQGFDVKHETCEVVKDFDNGTKKCYFNGKLVKEEKLTQADYTLPLEE